MSEQSPSDTALKLAEELIPNREAIRYYGGDWDELRERTALLIDQRLLLPEKHAALLCAQGVLDNYDTGRHDDSVARADAMDILRTALAKIR